MRADEDVVVLVEAVAGSAPPVLLHLRVPAIGLDAWVYRREGGDGFVLPVPAVWTDGGDRT